MLSTRSRDHHDANGNRLRGESPLLPIPGGDRPVDRPSGKLQEDTVQLSQDRKSCVPDTADTYLGRIAAPASAQRAGQSGFCRLLPVMGQL